MDNNGKTISTNLEYIYFIPRENRSLALSYYHSHKQILEKLNLGFLPSSNDWMNKENVYCFGILDPSNSEELISGLRIQIKKDSSLPIERSLERQSKKLIHFVKELEDNGTVAEMCGLWVNPIYAKQGLPFGLSNFALEKAKLLPITDLLIFYSKFTEELVKDLGFEQVVNLENGGEFPYPTDEYLSYVGHTVLK